MGHHRPLATRLSTCALKAAGEGAIERRWCRRRLHNQQAATMFSGVSSPPSCRATKCSAVHWKEGADRGRRPNSLCDFSHMRMPQ